MRLWRSGKSVWLAVEQKIRAARQRGMPEPARSSERTSSAVRDAPGQRFDERSRCRIGITTANDTSTIAMVDRAMEMLCIRALPLPLFKSSDVPMTAIRIIAPWTSAETQKIRLRLAVVFCTSVPLGCATPIISQGSLRRGLQVQSRHGRRSSGARTPSIMPPSMIVSRSVNGIWTPGRFAQPNCCSRPRSVRLPDNSDCAARVPDRRRLLDRRLPRR